MKRREFVTAPLVTAAMAGLSASGQEAPAYDTILKGGHVIDLANRVNQQMDVAVLGGKIARVDRSIPASAGRATVDVSGYYVTPGLIDLHICCYYTLPVVKTSSSQQINNFGGSRNFVTTLIYLGCRNVA